MQATSRYQSNRESWSPRTRLAPDRL